MVDIEQQEQVFKEEPIDDATAERIVGIYVRDYGRLPTEDYERSRRQKLEIPHKENRMIMELAAIVALRPKFLGYWRTNAFVSRVGVTPSQIEWLKKMVR